MLRSFLTITLVLGAAMTIFARAGETVDITEGHQKAADRGRLTIKFVEIVEDSRCPPDVTCVWAGNAKIKLAVSKGKAAPKFIELNTNLEPHSVKIAGYEIKLVSLSPKHSERLEMMERPKVAKISVTKG